MSVSSIVIITVVAALAFDVINGFHDAANSIATIVSTRVLSPRYAVLWAAFFNLAAVFFFGEGVAKTISGIIKIEFGDPAFVYVVFTGLIGAITWNLLTWWWGLPSSSSHALIGGVGGAGVAHAGIHVLVWAKLSKTLLFIVFAPLLGFLLGFIIMIAIYWLFASWRPTRVDKTFRVLQLISAGAYSLGHGGNDAQKTMGIIAAVFIASGHMTAQAAIPNWIMIASYSAMAFGTAFGGWRIVKTMGMGLTKLRPVGGFAAEVAGAITLFSATALKIPVSTTHTITGAIIGVGSTTRARGIRWGLATNIVVAWVLTIPASAAVGAGCYWIAQSMKLW